MKIRGVEMDIDVRSELEPYLHLFRKPTDKGTHLNACSPFRSDDHPSFYVYFEDTDSALAGYWGDHAASDDSLSRGTFLKLFAFLRNESEDTTFDYLNESYGTDAPADMTRLKLKTSRKMGAWLRTADDKVHQQSMRNKYNKTHQNATADAYRYLIGRGIDSTTLSQFHIGQSGRALAIPWYDVNGNMINVKYRSLDDKKFWYMEDGLDITGALFGIHHVYKTDIKRLHIVESEIDVMYLYTLGYYAVALGNKAMNEARAELLRKAPFEELVIIPDNDDAGRYAAETIISYMSSYKPVYIAEIPSEFKDINDLTSENACAILESAEQLNPFDSKITFKEFESNA